MLRPAVQPAGVPAATAPPGDMRPEPLRLFARGWDYNRPIPLSHPPPPPRIPVGGGGWSPGKRGKRVTQPWGGGGGQARWLVVEPAGGG